ECDHRSRSPHESKIKVEPEDEPLGFNPKRTPGAQPPLNARNPPPGEIFSHFFDAEVLKFLCENTNKNAAAKQKTEKTFTWTEIKPEELKKFIGMLLYMSVLRLPKISDFWRRETIFRVSFPATVMSKDRFLAILSHLHTSDPEKDVINERKKGTEDYDRLHWVRPLMEMICMRCKAIYHPRQHLLVEDRMAASKARRSMKQYIKAKPTKWWLKFFALTDSNGYTIDFQLYTGKSKLTSGNRLSYNAVADLVKKDFLGSGYIVCIDNLQTSRFLLDHLNQEGFGASGEYKQEKVDVPIKHENDLTTRSPQGSVQWIRKGAFLWMDTREASLCSTVHPVGNGDTAHHWLKEEGEEQEISIPSPTEEVDSSDQVIGTSLVHRNSRTWPITVFQHLFEIAVRNSFAIHKDRCDSMQQKPMVWQCFEEDLAAHLLGVSVKNKPQKIPDDQHLPVPTSSGQPRAHRASLGRRRCKVCHRSTAWMCETCDVGLCLQPDRNCHWQYHQDD
uniref:PiggyBac transposable element-derived protein domain-containing protein n=1 Tax=Amphilophus citrinellus TaxID=61819 RepID=A0A3Q0RV14_AMPCI